LHDLHVCSNEADIISQVYESILETEGHPSLPPFPYPSISLDKIEPLSDFTGSGPSISFASVQTITFVETVTVTASATLIINLPSPSLSLPTYLGSIGAKVSVSASMTSTLSKLDGTKAAEKMDGQDVFETVSLDAVPTNIAVKQNHPVPRTGIVSSSIPYLIPLLTWLTR
jgi:endo-1,3(4)-beta-glucanase